MSKFSQKVTDLTFSIFTALATDFNKPANWKKNWLPVASRERFTRYQLLDAMVNNYLGSLLRWKGMASVQYDEKGRLIESYEGYGEAKKIAGLISNAIVGDNLKLKTDSENVKKIWDDLLLSLKLPDGEDRGSELGDIIYHVAIDNEGKPQLEFVDPEGFFIFSKEFDKLIHAGWAWFPADGTKEEKELLVVQEYRLAGPVDENGNRSAPWRVYWRKAQYQVLEDNKSDNLLEGLSLFANLTTSPLDASASNAIVGDPSLTGWAILGMDSTVIDELPFVHIPFLSVAGELWGQSAIHYVFNAIANVYAINADLQQSARIAAIPIFWKKRDQYNQEGVFKIDPDTNEESSPAVAPGDMYDGEVGLVDNSASLAAALEYRRELMRIAHENNNIPSVITDAERAKIVSGIALDISLYPFRTFVNKVRAKRTVQYKHLLRVIMKRAGLWGSAGTDLDNTDVIFGVFANLGQQLMESIAKIVLAGVLTSDEGRAMLVESGILDGDLINDSFEVNNGSRNEGPGKSDNRPNEVGEAGDNFGVR